MLNLPFDRLLGSLGETLAMTAVSGAISFAGSQGICLSSARVEPARANRVIEAPLARSEESRAVPISPEPPLTSTRNR